MGLLSKGFWSLLVLSAMVGPVLAESVVVDPAVVMVPRWEGWGCSLSWWAVASRSWPAARRQEVCRRLFGRGQDCLGLNICRYNAGGTSPEADPKPFRSGAAVLTVVDRDGSWHPDRDHAQMECLRLARRYGADRFELFVNSPPYWMLANGNTRGGDRGRANLRDDSHQEYARWLVRVTQRVERSCGVRFSHVEPFNEPSAWWWNGATGGQEGCLVNWPAQANVIRLLRSALDAARMKTAIACSDENSADSAYNTLDYLTGAGGLDARVIGRLNVHSYNGWEWQERLRDLATARGIKSIWMSEVSHREWESAGFIPQDMRCALPQTRAVVSDISRLHCGGWVFWQPIEPLQYGLWYHYTYGLLPAAMDADVEWEGHTYTPGEYVETKAFYAMMQFTRFVRPGDRLLATGDPWSLAALSPDSRRLTVVVHNDGKEPRDYRFDLTKWRPGRAIVQVYRTMDGQGMDCKRMPDLAMGSGRLDDRAPARSVTTYVIRPGR